MSIIKIINNVLIPNMKLSKYIVRTGGVSDNTYE